MDSEMTLADRRAWESGLVERPEPRHPKGAKVELDVRVDGVTTVYAQAVVRGRLSYFPLSEVRMSSGGGAYRWRSNSPFARSLSKGMELRIAATVKGRHPLGGLALLRCKRLGGA